MNFDHMLPSFGDNLSIITANLRSQCPVAHSETHGGYWILSCYDEVTKTLCDETNFGSKKGTAIPAVKRQMQALPVEADPPDHTKYRSLLIPWLAARKVATYEPAIRRLVTELLNDFIEQGTCDLIASFAILLPALVTPVFMGLGRKEQPLFINYMKHIIEATETKNAEKNIKTRQSFMHYMLRETEKRKLKPRDDFFTSLVTARFDGNPLNEEEVICLILTILTAGLETSKNALGNLLFSLCEHSDARQSLISNPALIPLFVEESLRYHAPLQYVGRTIITDIAMQGQLLATDEKVLLLLGSANHDEQYFPHADQFIIDRSPNRHLSFGMGVHFCVGAPLARLEMRIVVEEILRRLPDYHLRTPIKRNFSADRVYGVETLPVAFTPGSVELLSERE